MLGAARSKSARSRPARSRSSVPTLAWPPSWASVSLPHAASASAATTSAATVGRTAWRRAGRESVGGEGHAMKDTKYQMLGMPIIRQVPSLSGHSRPSRSCPALPPLRSARMAEVPAIGVDEPAATGVSHASRHLFGGRSGREEWQRGVEPRPRPPLAERQRGLGQERALQCARARGDCLRPAVEGPRRGRIGEDAAGDLGGALRRRASAVSVGTVVPGDRTVRTARSRTRATPACRGRPRPVRAGVPARACRPRVPSAWPSRAGTCRARRRGRSAPIRGSRGCRAGSCSAARSRVPTWRSTSRPEPRRWPCPSPPTPAGAARGDGPPSRRVRPAANRHSQKSWMSAPSCTSSSPATSCNTSTIR